MEQDPTLRILVKLWKFMRSLRRCQVGERRGSRGRAEVSSGLPVRGQPEPR